MQNQYLKEACRIGNQLIAEAEHTAHGLYWTTVRSGSSSPVYEVSEDLYEGVSGIALFLIELYNVTHDDAFRTAAMSALDWVAWYCSQHPSDTYAFITGRLGVSYAFLRAGQVFGEQSYNDMALQIAKPSRVFLRHAPDADYINGVAGSIVALLQLHAASRKSWILDLIKSYTTYLLGQARYTGQGISWDQKAYHMRPLCGFSHGGSGIGYAFLELGTYFRNDAFYYVAEQAFAYEDAFFSVTRRNWPDFRVRLYTPEDRAKAVLAFRAGNKRTPPQAKDIFVWCHGAAGIGLVRQHAFALTKKPLYGQLAEQARKKTRVVPKYPFTLCHGHAGNAELFIHEPRARHFARAAIRQRQKLGIYRNGYNMHTEDAGLWNGIAGTGYCMLRVHDPMTTPSILAPVVNGSAPDAYPISVSDIKLGLLKNHFPRTIASLGIVDAELSLRAFIDFAGNTARQRPNEKNVAAPFAYEYSRHLLWQQLTNQAACSIEDAIHSENALDLAKTRQFTRKKLQLHPRCIISRTPEGEPVILRQTATTLTELTVSPFCAHVLASFRKPQTPAACVALLLPKFSSEKRAEAEKAIMQQIREAVENTLLIASNKQT